MEVPLGGLTIEKVGNLYGTTYMGGITAPFTQGSGTVFEVSNDPAPGRAAPAIVPKVERINTTIDRASNAKPGTNTVTLKNARSFGEDVSVIAINTETTAFTASQNCLVSLAPGKSCKVTITFTPSEVGKVGDLLNVISNAKNGALQHIPLIGIAKFVH
jgi:hypothetical protein